MKYVYFNQKYFSSKPEYHINGKVLLIPEPWLFYDNSILRVMSHIHLSPRINSKVSIPFKKIWIYDILKKSFRADENVCLIINAHFYHLFLGGIVNCSKKYFHSSKTIFIFSDRIEYFKNHYKDFPSLERIKESFDMVITYNTDDAQKYGLVLDRPCFPTYTYEFAELGDNKSDVFFVGNNKGRIKEILRVYEILKMNGLKCDFHIIGVPENEQKYQDEIVYNKRISYSEVLERVKRTNCVMNIIQKGGAGVTLRDYETFTFNKLALTNNTALVDVGMYNRNQVIWISELPERVSEIKEFESIESEYVQEYSQAKWYEWLDKKICAGEF